MVIPTGLPHSSIFSYSELVLTRSYCALICPSRSHCSLRHLRASRPPAPLALSRLCVRHGPSSGEHAHAHCNSDPKSCTRTGGGVAWCGVLGHIVDAHMHNSMELRSLLIFTPPPRPITNRGYHLHRLRTAQNGIRASSTTHLNSHGVLVMVRVPCLVVQGHRAPSLKVRRDA